MKAILPRRLWHWWKRQDTDPAWKPTGYTYTFTGHDEAQGVAAVRQADRAAVQRRRTEAARATRGPQ